MICKCCGEPMQEDVQTFPRSVVTIVTCFNLAGDCSLYGVTLDAATYEEKDVTELISLYSAASARLRAVQSKHPRD